MPIERLSSDLCTGCHICVDVCPEDVLRFKEDKRKAYIAYPEDCIACWVCEWFCPVKCIEVSKDPAKPFVVDY